MAEVITTLEHKAPGNLKNHPLNAQIYGDVADDEFVASCKGGIHTPLIITKDNLIVSGHRRRQAAMKLQLKDVPVLVRHDLTDPLQIQIAFLDCNEQRDKTVEQRTREYQARKGIEIELAKERRRLHGGTAPGKPSDSAGKPPEITPPKMGEVNGEAAKIAAQSVGMSHTTAEKASEVVDAIDEAEAGGDTETATALRETLEQNVAGAHRRVAGKPKPNGKPKKPAVPKHLEPVLETTKRLNGLIQQLGKIRQSIEQLAGLPGGEKLQVSQIVAETKNAQMSIKASRFKAVCPYCKGKKCEKCEDLGWMTEFRYRGIAKERK